MIEEVYHLAQGNSKTIEKVLMDEDIHYMHMILNTNEGLPEHFSNAKSVYMTVVRGCLSIALDQQGFHEYPAGTMLKIPGADCCQGTCSSNPEITRRMNHVLLPM